MKPFWDCKEEEIACINLQRLLDHLMCPQTSHGSFHRVNLEGRNVGASMVMQSCSINIYINNNVQGVNNSALLGSQVKMGDPGVYLTFRGVKFNEDSRETNKRNGESNEKGLAWDLNLHEGADAEARPASTTHRVVPFSKFHSYQKIELTH
ncbi:hypothetical protein AAG906_040765 [Vitis piasezkii]